MSRLVSIIKSIVVMPEFEDSRSAAMWQHRFNPLMLLWVALTR